MSIFHTHCALRLGDNLVSLHFLRKLADKYPEHRFIHAAHAIYLPQLIEVTCDIPNLQLMDLGSVSDGNPHGPERWTMKPRHESRNLWKNDGAFWERHPLVNDYVGFHLAFYDDVARQMGLETPLTHRRDMLFDYPMIRKADVNIEPFDFLIVNSTPLSGQFRGYNEEQFTALILALANKYRVVVTQRINLRNVAYTGDYGLSVTGIGNLSLKCHKILMVATGPCWPTFNIWNAKSIDLRIVLTDGERLDFGDESEHASSIACARQILEAKGLL